jgi:oligopeptide transport system permease protein
MLVALVVLDVPGTARLVRGQSPADSRRRLHRRLPPARRAHRLSRIAAHDSETPSGDSGDANIAIPSVIFIEAFLSFIGMGVAPPHLVGAALANDGIRHNALSSS